MIKIVVDEIPNLMEDCPFSYMNPSYTWEMNCTLRNNGHAPCHLTRKYAKCPFLVSFDTLMRKCEMEKETEVCHKSLIDDRIRTEQLKKRKKRA